MGPTDLNSGASWFLNTGSFSVLGTLPLSWEALEESLVERLMLLSVPLVFVVFYWITIDKSGSGPLSPFVSKPKHPCR